MTKVTYAAAHGRYGLNVMALPRLVCVAALLALLTTGKDPHHSEHLSQSGARCCR